ncbi:hypothetical protein A9P82_07805 [Arachidicoccus ginsenosidimutans]|uniref:DUF3108 domain-containing protein n=1 Tax=Arachidicoccus sp. BS20 TaxID=1850526 RepID=UPI0007F14A60|nr:DUF3108 domain-containing protein [Arachidicoccus sp. BS20]ANI89203.1 hypothetical protein A9P82_07805 [Arachidicoccus sp. BS20]
MKKYILIILLSAWHCAAFSQTDDALCGMENTSFKAGESFTLTVYYSVAGIYVSAGTATVSTSLGTFNNKPVYHILCLGKSGSSYDWIFKVRDRYESYIDTATMQSLKFIRQIHEGSYKKNEDVAFNRETNTTVTNKGVYKTPECIQDVISAVFNARNVDYSRYKINDRIPFKMFLDNQVYNLYVRYMGKEKVKTRFGTFNAIKLKPLLIKGEMFKGGEKMTLWVSDDANHIPLRVESPITVGSIKVDMTGYKGLRYALSSQVK